MKSDTDVQHPNISLLIFRGQAKVQGQNCRTEHLPTVTVRLWFEASSPNLAQSDRYRATRSNFGMKEDL